MRRWVLSTRLGKWARKSPRNRAALFLIGLALIIVSLLLPGCIERQELREQHCALVSIARHGAKPCSGTYYIWVEGNRCYTRLWNQTMIYEGHLDPQWRPE